jgi:hypothetical protein
LQGETIYPAFRAQIGFARTGSLGKQRAPCDASNSPIPAQLRTWLDCARGIGGKLPTVNYADKLKRTLEKAGLRAEWPQNALRHSFASYHYAKFRNENETAAIMGNSPQMIFQHYRELVRPAEAEVFFRIIPPPDAYVRARAARVGRRRTMPPRSGKITAEIISTVFNNGRLTLTRKDAVAAICERSGCKIPSAYLALSENGRFRSQLQETNGFLSWQPFPLVIEIEAPAEIPKNPLIPFPLVSEPEKFSVLKS